jgi:hypothetical protein
VCYHRRSASCASLAVMSQPTSPFVGDTLFGTTIKIKASLSFLYPPSAARRLRHKSASSEWEAASPGEVARFQAQSSLQWDGSLHLVIKSSKKFLPRILSRLRFPLLIFSISVVFNDYLPSVQLPLVAITLLAFHLLRGCLGQPSKWGDLLFSKWRK